MSQKEVVLNTIKGAGKALKAGEIESLSGLAKKEVEKAMNELRYLHSYPLVSSGFTKMCLLTQITMPHIPFLFVSTGFLPFGFLQVHSSRKTTLPLANASDTTPRIRDTAMAAGIAPSGKTHPCCLLL